MYRSLWRAKERAAHDLAGVQRRKMPKVQANIEASVQLLSVGCAETSPSCLVISDRERFMINVGEGSQRLAMEHRVRIVRYDHIFITSLTTECIGGLPGMLLTLADQGKKSITLHGPVGLKDFYYATRHFMRREELRVDVREYTTSGLAAAGANLTMHAIPLGASCGNGDVGCGTSGGDMGVDGGGGDHEAGVSAAAVDGDMSSASVEVHDGGNSINNGEELGSSAPGCHGDSSNVGSDQVKAQRDESHAQYRRRKRPRQGPAPKLIAWMGETAGVHGKFDVARAKALGIPAGPLYGKLKGGEAVELSDGRVIQPEEVVASSIPGVVYAIFHCPNSSSIAHLPSVDDVRSSLVQGRDVSCVVHMTPYDVLCTEAYQAWSKSFGDNTTHVVASLPTRTSRSPFRASKLNNLRLHILDDQAFPRALGFDALPPLPTGLGTKAMWGDSLLKYTLLPKAKEGLDTSPVVSDVTAADETRLREHVESVRAMAPSIPDAPAASTSTNGSLTSHSSSPPDSIHPPISSDDNHAANVQVVFLGTGAALPSKYRNVTGIMVVVRKADGTRATMLLDCGEGTLGQLASLYPGPDLDDVLRSLCAVWISHPHADHHLGLTRVLATRKRLLQGVGSARGAGSEPLVVLAPKPVLAWLKAYQAWDPDVCWGGPDSLVELAPGSHTTPSWAAGLMKDRLGVSGVHNVRVEHCPHAYALVLDHQDGWRLVYSGDLRPSDKLIKAGEGATVLIHEATFEAAKHGEAVDRKHCTVDEALEVARRMRASSVLLTHFSQRYPKFPVLPDDAGLNVCVAFDLMTVKFEDLTRVAQLLPVLQQLFPGEEEESEDGDAEQVESGAKDKDGGGEKAKQKKKGKDKVKGQGNVEGGAKGGTVSKGKGASSL